MPKTITPSFAMVRTLGLVSVICGIIIVGVYQLTLPAVNANKKLALERQVFKVIPSAKKVVTYFATPTGIVLAEGQDQPPAQAMTFYAVYDEAINWQASRPRLLPPVMPIRCVCYMAMMLIKKQSPELE
jgi:hypothetical protein